MVKGNEDGETGFGIDPMKHIDIWRLITVDCQNQKVIIEDYGEISEEYTFEEFIKREN